MALKGKAKRAIQDGVDNHEPFKVGNVSGRLFRNWTEVPKGRLAGTSWEAAASGEHGQSPVYVVFSYGTPIAYYGKRHGWTVPDVKYSATTTSHQNVTRTAIDNPGFYSETKW